MLDGVLCGLEAFNLEHFNKIRILIGLSSCKSEQC